MTDAAVLSHDDKSSSPAAPSTPLKQVQSDIQEKYGWPTPKKPLISRVNHKRAYFDSADWALFKQSAANRAEGTVAAMESLKPKLTRTPHQTLSPRKPSFASSC